MKRLAIFIIIAIVLSSMIYYASFNQSNNNTRNFSENLQNTRISYGKDINDKLFSLITRYEEYIRLYENDSYGYEKLLGYPMYLFAFGDIYYDLYNITSSHLYLQKFWRAVNYSLKVKNDDWTWTGYIGYSVKSSLYNLLGYDLYLRAYNISKNESYLNYAKYSLLGMVNTSYPISPAYNANAFIGCEIADYINRFGNNSILYNLGRKSLEFSLRGIDGLRWYYSEYDLHAKNYYGRSAFYQNIVLASLINERNNMEKIYPQLWNKISYKIQEMFNYTLKYLTPDGAWLYKDDVLEYTEGAGNLIHDLYIFDSHYGYNHSYLIKKLTDFIVKESCINGAFWKDAYTRNQVLLWYTDNIGEEIAEYLSDAGYKNNYVPEDFNYTYESYENLDLNSTTYKNYTFLIAKNLTISNATVRFYNVTSEKIYLYNSTLMAYQINSSYIYAVNSTILADFINSSNITTISSAVNSTNIETENISSNSSYIGKYGANIIVKNISCNNTNIYGKFLEIPSGNVLNTKLNGFNLTVVENYKGNINAQAVIIKNSDVNVSSQIIYSYNSTVNVKNKSTVYLFNSTLWGENESLVINISENSNISLSNVSINQTFLIIENSNLSFFNVNLISYRCELINDVLNISQSEINTTELLCLYDSKGEISNTRASNLLSKSSELTLENLESRQLSQFYSKMLINNITADYFGEFNTIFQEINNSTSQSRKILLNGIENGAICIIEKNLNISNLNAIIYIYNSKIDVKNSNLTIYASASNIYSNNSALNISMYGGNFWSNNSNITGFFIKNNVININNSISNFYLLNIGSVSIKNNRCRSIVSWNSLQITIENNTFKSSGVIIMKSDNLKVVENSFSSYFSLYLFNVSTVEIYLNSFFCEDVYDDLPHSWNNTQYGNYWPSWLSQSNDSNNDGILDDPYPIRGNGAMDYKPLASPPVEEFPNPILIILLLLVFISFSKFSLQNQ